jgi:hypothetical protein
MKNLIIFGAGASYGSDNCDKVPPLGNKLFSALQEFDPSGWGKLDGLVAKEFEDDFEKAMNNLFSLNPYDIMPLQRSMAFYFFRFQPTLNNLYCHLAKLIFKRQWDGALITLNYERLLEIALNSVGISTYYVRTAPPKFGISNTPSIELCIPHGACHIFCPAIKGGGKIKWDASSTVTSGRVELVNEQDAFDKRIKDGLPPVMSYFVPSKQTTSGIDFINEQRKRYKDLVGEADNIAIIGLKVREHDKHIWEPLANTKAKLIYCSGKEGADEFSKWVSEHRTGKNDVVLRGFFKECFDELCQCVKL